MSETYPVAAYVHLGSNLPRHLLLSLKRHRSIFPEQRIVLIVDQYVETSLLIEVEIFKIDSDNLNSELFDIMSQHLDFNFRNGFWKFTLQRLFALNEFHQTVPESHLVHIESDVLVMPEFPWNKFGSLKKIAWLRVNNNIDVAAIVFLPNSSSTLHFTTEIAKMIRKNPAINDMQALHEYANQNPNRQVYLPSLTPKTVRNIDLIKEADLEMLAHFGGIFDPLILGLWYFGQDPKNSFGIRRRYLDDPNHDLNPKSSLLSFSNGTLQDQNGTKIFSLHVHSKFLPLFMTEWESELSDGLQESANESKQISFHARALIAAFKGRKLRVNLWIMLGALPGVNNLRKIGFFEVGKNKIKRLLRI